MNKFSARYKEFIKIDIQNLEKHKNLFLQDANVFTIFFFLKLTYFVELF